MDVSLGASLYADAKWHGLLDDPFRAPRSMKSGPGVVKNFLTFSQIWALKYTNHWCVSALFQAPEKLHRLYMSMQYFPSHEKETSSSTQLPWFFLCGKQKGRGQFQNLQEHHILMQYFQMRVLSEACI